ncbi:MAG: 5-formyltetrahydrofolate cyclo-ligase [Albidovulum sp.]|nr:5-formyltetrahydrofolate cyclo-ligase [Albidovulum sp.]
MSNASTKAETAGNTEAGLNRAKRVARIAAKNRRRAAYSRSKCDRACEILVEYAQSVPDLDIVSAYVPIMSEISPLNAMHDLFRNGMRVCLPVVVDSRQPLSFREWHPGISMEIGAFGTSAPAQGEWLDPKLLVVPLLAFDRQGNRLGYGGGFYDRTIAKLESAKAVRKVGFAFAEQECVSVPRGDGDRRLDAIVTQSEVIRVDDFFQLAQA